MLEHFHDEVTFLDVPQWRQLAALDLADGFRRLEVDAGRDDLVAEVAMVAPPAFTSAPPEPGDCEGTQTTRLNLVAHLQYVGGTPKAWTCMKITQIILNNIMSANWFGGIIYKIEMFEINSMCE